MTLIDLNILVLHHIVEHCKRSLWWQGFQFPRTNYYRNKRLFHDEYNRLFTEESDCTGDLVSHQWATISSLDYRRY